MKWRIFRDSIIVLVYFLYLGGLLVDSGPTTPAPAPTPKAPTNKVHKNADNIYDILKVKNAVKREFVEIWKHTEV